MSIVQIFASMFWNSFYLGEPLQRHELALRPRIPDVIPRAFGSNSRGLCLDNLALDASADYQFSTLTNLRGPRPSNCGAVGGSDTRSE
jgi:hypothetical protein